MAEEGEYCFTILEVDVNKSSRLARLDLVSHSRVIKRNGYQTNSAGIHRCFYRRLSVFWDAERVLRFRQLSR